MLSRIPHSTSAVQQAALATPRHPVDNARGDVAILGVIAMKKLSLMMALAWCVPAAWAADGVSCAPEKVSKGGLVNTTVCTINSASVDKAYQAVYYTDNPRIKGYLQGLKLPAKLPAKSTKLVVASGEKRDCGKTKINGEWVDDTPEPKMELAITRRANGVHIRAEEVDNCANVENFELTFKRVGNKVRMVYEWHHS